MSAPTFMLVMSLSQSLRSTDLTHTAARPITALNHQRSN